MAMTPWGNGEETYLKSARGKPWTRLISEEDRRKEGRKERQNGSEYYC